MSQQIRGSKVTLGKKRDSKTMQKGHSREGIKTGVGKEQGAIKQKNSEIASPKVLFKTIIHR